MTLDDKGIIQTPDIWANWPILPLIRPREGSSPEVGVMIDGGGLVVYLINMYYVQTQEQLNRTPSLTYGSIEALLDDGWKVDG